MSQDNPSSQPSPPSQPSQQDPGAEALEPLIEAMKQTWGSILDLAESLDPDDWSRPTRCPGWDVHDQIAHVVSLEQLLAGGPLSPPAPEAAYIRNEFGAHMERGVHALRGTSPVELIGQLRDVIAARTAALDAKPLHEGDLVLGAMGNEVRAEQSLPLRVFDLWAHEQDVRAAVGRPGNESGPGAEISRDAIVSMLPMHWAKSAGAEPGELLTLRVHGGLEFERSVIVGANGRAELLDVAAAPAGATAPAKVVIDLAWADLAARACGRDGSAQSPADVTGDQEMGQAVLEALPMSP